MPLVTRVEPVRAVERQHALDHLGLGVAKSLARGHGGLPDGRAAVDRQRRGDVHPLARHEANVRVDTWTWINEITRATLTRFVTGPGSSLALPLPRLSIEACGSYDTLASFDPMG